MSNQTAGGICLALIIVCVSALTLGYIIGVRHKLAAPPERYFAVINLTTGDYAAAGPVRDLQAEYVHPGYKVIFVTQQEKPKP